MGNSRGGAVEGLYLTLFVDAQDQRAFRRVHVKTHDVAYLVDEERILGELEGLRAMRGQRKGAPDTADRGLVDACGLDHRARGPMGGGGRFGLEREGQGPFDLGAGDLARLSGTGSSSKPSTSASPKRCHHFLTVAAQTLNSAAISATESPSTARTTILDRSASA
jgi:hypothetical protein